MRIASLADVKAKLSAYVDECQTEGPIVITRNGKPVAVLLAPQDNDDLERLLLARNPRFQALMAQAEESIKAGRTLSSDEFWRQAYTRADARAAGQATAITPSTAPAIAESRVEYQTNTE
jgi:prevent-host-death family protein